MDRDWVTVVPEVGTVKATAQALLVLAHDPAHVRTQRNGVEFLVPPYLAELYNTPAPKRRRKSQEVGDE